MATSNTPGISLTKEFVERFEKVEKHLFEKSDADKRSPAGAMSAFAPAGQSIPLPTQEQVMRLAKSYGPEMSRYYLRKNAPIASGRSDSLRRLCEISFKEQGWPQRADSASYGVEQFEREHGFVPWSKHLRQDFLSGNTVVQKASNMAENSGVLGGYAVPPDFRSQLLTIEEEESTILPLCMRVPMTTKTATFPSLDITTNYGTGQSPYEAGVFMAWQPEAAAINQSNAQLRQFELTNWDLVTYIVMSNDLIQDNAVGLDSVIMKLLGTSSVFYKEYACQNGLGAGNSMPLGVLNAASTLGVDRATSNKIGINDIYTMRSVLQMRSWDNVVWHAHQSTIPQLAQLISNATTGQFAWFNPNGEGVEGPMARKMPDNMIGGRLHFTQTCQQLGSTGDFRAVDWSQYFVGERLGLQIAVFDQYLATTNQILFRAVERIGAAPWLNKYITDAQGFTVSPYVILDVHS